MTGKRVSHDCIAIIARSGEPDTIADVRVLRIREDAMEGKAITVIAKIGDNAFAVKCSYCAGRGTKITEFNGWTPAKWGASSCDVCGGKGVIRIDVDDLPFYCALCKGTGHSRDGNYDRANTNSTCPTCQKLGIVSLSGKVRIIK